MSARQTIHNLLERIVFHEPSSYETGCWNIPGYTPSKNGYCGTTINGTTQSLHLHVYEHFRGLVPEGKELHHKCRNRVCCNPDHLEALTRQEHVACHPRVACPKGHPHNDPINRYIRKTGKSYCRICAQEKKNALKRPRKQGFDGNHYANRTVCKKGHPYTPENTYVRPDGMGRACKTCHRQLSAKAAGKAKEARHRAKVGQIADPQIPRASSGYKGAYQTKSKKNPWQASIDINGFRDILGNYPTAELAARQYDWVKLQLYGEGYYLNFPRKEYPDEI